MYRLDNPITDLHECIAHAQYEGFSDIPYEVRDFNAIRAATTKEEKAAALELSKSALRRPDSRDFSVYAMFPQLWGSTALGHGGVGGAAMTTAYTVVLYCDATKEFLVYFGGRFCYKVNGKSKNLDVFHEDICVQNLVSKHESGKYN